MFSTIQMAGLPDPDIDQQFYADVPLRRLAAWIVDCLIILGLTVAALILSLFTLTWILPIVATGLSIAYRTIMLQRYSATVGMLWMGIEIRNGAGERVGPQLALLHSTTFSLMFFIPILPIIGMIMMLVTQYKQGLHDLPFGTTAIRTPNV
ncbi:MAG: RDD family protein [Pseudomonadota bacterium]